MEVLTGIVVLVAGAVVGYFISKLQHRDDYSEKLFNDYIQMEQELALILEDLLTLSMWPCDCNTKFCNTIDNALSKYYFKYYLVLPQEVLEEISCLHACLQCGGEELYMVDRTKETPVLRPRKTEEEKNKLFKNIALIETKLIKQNKIRIPNYLILKCQARHVISVMHDSWKPEDFQRWQKKLPKRTILQIEESINHKNITK